MRKHVKKQKGIVLVVSLFFIVIFSAISLGIFTLTSNNTITASNLHRANEARSSAESGLEVIRHYVSQIVIPGMTPVNERFDVAAGQMVSVANSNLESQLAYAHLDSYEPHIHIGNSYYPITLNGEGSFYARITGNGTGGFNIQVTGQFGDIRRTIYTGFTYGVREHNVFDYGVASKGAVTTQSITLDGVNVSIEADMYIESMTNTQSLLIGNSSIAGEVKIVNPDGSVTMTGASSIGGETGINAINNHVEVGVPPTEFPYPNTSHFEQYINGITIDSTNISSYSSNSTLNNVRIAAGTNPTFDGNTIINGVMYIEQPNVVTIKGGTHINGVIVGDGDVSDNSGTNQIIFEGDVISSSVANLPETEEFAGLQDETGTFVMAPGFAVSMGGDVGTLSGCIASNGFTSYGNASGIIEGSVLNYSTETMSLGGDDLYFNRSGITEVPAGFVPEIIIYYNSSAYSEIAGI